MNRLLQALRSNPLLWLLAAVPAVFIGEHLAPASPVFAAPLFVA